MSKKFFIERRSGNDRRSGEEQRYNPRLDLPHKRRRVLLERRRKTALRVEDFYALNELAMEETANKPLLH
jgi:hypothetical protein